MNPLARINQLIASLMLAFIRMYQILLSPIMGRQCRYWPTCSHYGAEAIGRFGPWRGGWMALCRVLRCHPFHKGGYDPVPEADDRGHPIT